MRIILGIIIGMIGMGIAQAIACSFMDLSRTNSSFLGSGVALNATFGAFTGAIAGAFIGGMVTGFNLPFSKSAIFSFGLSLLAGYIFYRYTDSPLYNYIIRYAILCYLFLGTTTGTLISILNKPIDNDLLVQYSPSPGKLTAPLTQPFAFIQNLPLWQWFVIVPIILWAIYLSLALYNYMVARPSIRQDEERIQRIQEERLRNKKNDSSGYTLTEP